MGRLARFRQVVGNDPVFQHRGFPGWRLRMIAIGPSRCSRGALMDARFGRRLCENVGWVRILMNMSRGS
jgi:hypothetical protein